MSRYIDADEFGRCLQNYRPYVDSGRFNAIQTEVNQVLDCIEYEIEDTPSIDIVCCRECKWLDSGKNDSEVWSMCTRHFEKYFDVNADDFCSYGEREGE